MLDISIVITTFNSEKFIKSCLNSIFAQDYRNLEIIVVDNGSVDSTEIFVKKYRPKIKFLKNIKNRGASYARNQGIDISCAEYVMCMDSDTYLEKNFLHHLKKVLSNIPPRVCAISPKILKEDSNKIFSCGISISSIYRAYDVGCDKTDKEFNDSFLIDGPSSCCGIFRRESLERIKMRMFDSGAADKTKEAALSFINLAKEKLSVLSSSSCKESLLGLADFVKERGFNDKSK